MRINTIVCVIFAFLMTFGCATSYTSYYPSYEDTMAKYAPPGDQPYEKCDDASMYPDSDQCDCPRVWYVNHWVYYYHGSWIFWHHGFWYYYPYFDWYYFGYGPILYRGPGRVIISSSKSKAETARSIQQEQVTPGRITDANKTRPAEIRPTQTPSRSPAPSRSSSSSKQPSRTSPSSSKPTRK